jgi:hypothetical protein
MTKRVIIPVSREFYDEFKKYKDELTTKMGRVSWPQASTYYLNDEDTVRTLRDRRHKKP